MSLINPFQVIDLQVKSKKKARKGLIAVKKHEKGFFSARGFQFLLKSESC